MDLLDLGVVVVVVLALFLKRFYKANAAQKWAKKENLPPILNGAKLILNEKPIRIKGSISLHGTPDQVFLAKNNCLVIVDTKTRKWNRVYLSDRIQLSVYAYILNRLRGQKETIRAFVRLPNMKGGVAYKEVTLIWGREFESLVHRFRSIKQHSIKPICQCRGNFHD